MIEPRIWKDFALDNFGRLAGGGGLEDIDVALFTTQSKLDYNIRHSLRTTEKK